MYNMVPNIALGQYFTTNEILKEKIFEFIKNKPNLILEPSCGRGDLIKYVKNKMPDCDFDKYEIDKKIKFLRGIKKGINFGDFLEQKLSKKYTTIIGNPPYIRTKTGNLYIDFIDKCHGLLESNGELIFIIPSDFFKRTCASHVLTKLMNTGTFTHIYHPHNEKLFENATIDVLIFRYCKNPELEKKVMYNDKLLHIVISDGIITFEEHLSDNSHTIGENFDIYVGLVSGKESVFKNALLGNMSVLIGENKVEKYIFAPRYPTRNSKINKYLLEHKKELLAREIRKFDESNWFEWGAPRNITIMRQNFDEDCIYVYNLTRHEKVAFLGKIMYFGGNLLMLKPKKEMDLTKWINYINSIDFKKKWTFSGRFKIGHKQLASSILNFEISHLR